MSRDLYSSVFFKLSRYIKVKTFAFFEWYQTAPTTSVQLFRIKSPCIETPGLLLRLVLVIGS